jgi:hypothetical protein
MCCTGQSILGIDKTFNLCDMHITASCYKQTSVKMETTDEPPIFLGPIFIHDNSDFHIFTHFFHHYHQHWSSLHLRKFPPKAIPYRSYQCNRLLVVALRFVSNFLCTKNDRLLEKFLL